MNKDGMNGKADTDKEEERSVENAVVLVPLSVFAVAVSYMKTRPYGEVAPIVTTLERSNVVDISDLEKQLYSIAFYNIKNKTSDMMSAFTGHEQFNKNNDDEIETCQVPPLFDESDNSVLASEDEIMKC